MDTLTALLLVGHLHIWFENEMELREESNYLAQGNSANAVAFPVACRYKVSATQLLEGQTCKIIIYCFHNSDVDHQIKYIISHLYKMFSLY